MKTETKARILSIASVLAVFSVGFLPQEHWLENVGVLIHVWTWALLVLAFISVFMEDMPEYKPWYAIPTTIAWILALSFVGWTIALGFYGIIVLIGVIRRLNL